MPATAAHTVQGDASTGASHVTPRLTLTGVSKSFGPNRVLENVDLCVSHGEVVGLLGENGAGKSTLMNIVSGGLRADEGKIEFDGTNVDFESISAAIEAGVAFVHQELSVVGALTVAENLYLGRLPSVIGNIVVDFRAMAEGARGILDNVGATEIAPNSLAATLRAGEQQLVEIAKAAARDPKLLILDEPTSSLTPHEVSGFKAYVNRARSAGTSIIFITHRLEEALELCDRILVLRNGRIVAERLPAQTNRDQIIIDMTGKESLFERRKGAVGATTVALRADRLSDGEHLADLNFEVAKGEIFGLFGLVGAGRTETLEMICGARRIASGSLQFFGSDFQAANPSAALAHGIVIVPEGRKTAGILPQHTMRGNVSASSLRSFATGPFVSRVLEGNAVEKFRQALSIKMTSDRQLITTLSGGNQQKAIFARAFLAAPRLLLLDEPTHGVDVGAKADLYEIISDAAKDGLTIIVASSEIPEIMAICDRTAVLSKGRLAGVFDGSEMTEQVILEAAFSQHEVHV